MPTHIPADDDHHDDDSNWEDEHETPEPDPQPSRKTRLQEIEKRLEDERLRRELDNSYDSYDDDDDS